MGFEQPSHVPSISAELLLGEEGSRLEAGHGVGVGGQRQLQNTGAELGDEGQKA